MPFVQANINNKQWTISIQPMDHIRSSSFSFFLHLSALLHDEMYYVKTFFLQA